MPVKPWKGIRDVTNFGRKCPTLEDLSKMTKEYRRAVDTENCLNMAIYSPNVIPILFRLSLPNVNFFFEKLVTWIVASNGLRTWR